MPNVNSYLALQPIRSQYVTSHKTSTDFFSSYSPLQISMPPYQAQQSIMNYEDFFLSVVLFGNAMAFIYLFIDSWLPTSTKRALQPAKGPPIPIRVATTSTLSSSASTSLAPAAKEKQRRMRWLHVEGAVKAIRPLRPRAWYPQPTFQTADI